MFLFAFGNIFIAAMLKKSSWLKACIQGFHVVRDLDQIGLCQRNIKYSVWNTKIQFDNIVKIPPSVTLQKQLPGAWFHYQILLWE